MGVVHRDIKPQNILIDEEGFPQLCDFGKSKQISTSSSDLFAEDEDLTTTIEGTPAFYAPECCNIEQTEQPKYSMKKADIWALGVTLYCMTFN